MNESYFFTVFTFFFHYLFTTELRQCARYWASLKRSYKEHGGQTKAKTLIFKGLSVNNAWAQGDVDTPMDSIFNAEETDFSAEIPYDKCSNHSSSD